MYSYTGSGWTSWTNGAGKSTLMRMICGVMKPTSGTVRLGKYDATNMGYRNLLGYLPQDFGYDPDFTGMEFLLYVTALKGLGKKTAKERSENLLEQVNLEKDAIRKVKTYSGGMKRRLRIAQTLRNKLLESEGKIVSDQLQKN